MSRRAWFVVWWLAGCADQVSEEDLRCSADAPWRDTQAAQYDELEPPAVDASQPAVGGICDGSDQLRLVVASQPGPHALSDWRWQTRVDRPLLIVDGHCRYYAAQKLTLGRVTEGQLTAAMLEQLTADLALDRLAELPSSRDDCSDSSDDRLIATQEHSLRCRCDDCGEHTDSTQAIQNALTWIDRLAAEGQPRNAVLAAIARPHVPIEDVVDTRAVYDWPIETRVHQVRSLLAQTYREDKGTYFSGSDAAALRHLREQTLSAHESDYPTVVRVRDCGTEYQLNLRDELPFSVEYDLEMLLDVAWKRPVIPSCVTFDSPVPLEPCPLADY